MSCPAGTFRLKLRPSFAPSPHELFPGQERELRFLVCQLHDRTQFEGRRHESSNGHAVSGIGFGDDAVGAPVREHEPEQGRREHRGEVRDGARRRTQQQVRTGVSGQGGVGLPHRVVDGLVGLEDAERFAGQFDQVRVVGVQPGHKLVDLLDLVAGVLSHAPETCSFLGDPGMHDAGVLRGVNGEQTELSPRLEVLLVGSDPRSRDAWGSGDSGHGSPWKQ